MAETQIYREWLHSSPTQRGVLETIQVSHSRWGDIYLANWDVDVDCVLEDVDGSPTVTHKATRFELQPAGVSDGTDQTTVLRVSNFDGLLYDEIRQMTPEERRDESIRITARLYWTTHQNNLLIDPPAVWTVHNMSFGLDAVDVELQVLPLRIHRTGIYFTALEFPILALIR